MALGSALLPMFTGFRWRTPTKSISYTSTCGGDCALKSHENQQSLPDEAYFLLPGRGAITVTEHLHGNANGAAQ